MTHRAILALPLLVACSSSESSPPPPFTYAAQSCSYKVTPPASRSFTGLALDDAKPLTDVAGSAPIRPRLGLGGAASSSSPGGADPSTSVVMTWETAATSNAARVRIGTSPTALTDERPGYSWTTPPPTVGLGTTEAPVQMHEVHVCGLTPATTYYYQVGGGASGADAWSATQTFTTAPASGPVTIGFSGDSRDSASVFQMVQLRMRDAAPTLQLFSGDFVLVGSQESLYMQWLDAAWKDPKDATKFLTLGQQVVLAAPGNHENSSSQFYGNFALPGDDGDFAEMFSSVNVGPAHIVLLDDQSISGDPTQDESKAALAFLDDDLGKADADRAAHPFVIAVHHRGEFSTSNHGTDSDVTTARDALVPLWDKHHVDLVVNGHDHNYERTNPVTGPGSAPVVQSSPTQGTTYVVCAGAGASAYSPGTGTVAYRAKNAGFGSGTPYVGVYGMLTIDAHKLSLKAYGLKASGAVVADDDVIDTFETTR